MKITVMNLWSTTVERILTDLGASITSKRYVKASQPIDDTVVLRAFVPSSQTDHRPMSVRDVERALNGHGVPKFEVRK